MGGGAIEHVFQPREVDAAGARLAHHELHRGGHHEQLGDAGLLEEVQHLGRIELARDDALGAVIEAYDAPAGTADVKHRHHHQRDIVGGPFVPIGLVGVAAGLDQIEEIRVRQHRAFRLARGARRIELDRDVLPADLDIGVIGALRVAPGRKIPAFWRAAFRRDDCADARQSVQDVADEGDELGADEQHRRLAVLDDESHFGGGEAPVHGRHHHIGLDRAEQQLEIEVAVLAQIGDAFMRLDAQCFQAVADAVGLDIKFRERSRAPLEFEGDRVAAGFRAVAHHLGKRPSVLLHRTCRFPRDPFVFVARILASSRGKDNTEVSSPPLQYVARRTPRPPCAPDAVLQCGLASAILQP